MAYCSQCGSELWEGAQFCASCGAATGPAQAPSQPAEAGDPTERSAEASVVAPSAAGLISKDIRNVAMFCHLASFAGLVGVPFGNILGPLLVWLLKREESTFIDAHGKEALNFQISVAIYASISIVLMYASIFTVPMIVLIGFVLLVALLVFGVVSVIIAAVRANSGQEYRYRLAMRFIK